MSKSKPGPLGEGAPSVAPELGRHLIAAWAPEASGMVARRPSWIARKLSTRPPVPSAAPPPSSPAQAEQHADEPPVIVAAPQPPPPAAADVASSMALAQLADENAALRAQIVDMAATMARLRREVLEASEGELVRLAVAIAERVVGRELTCDPGLVVAWSRDAIEQLAAKDDVVIAVAREGLEVPTPEVWDGLGLAHRVQSDPQLAAGVIEVRTAEGTIATGVGPRTAAVAQALGVVDP